MMDMFLPAPVKAALSRLEAAGHDAFVVGGCVRDQVLGVTPHDYDICTSAVPQEMQRVFAGERTIETGIRHGTLTVLLSGMPLEITTFRVDGEYLDGRHPASVRFARQVEEDLSRRDFTVNAMAYSPRAGLVDPFGGRQDCRAGLIRCVGKAEERFREDALRILRALRFSARLGFPIERDTDRALRAGKEQLKKISRERIAAELTGLLQGKEAERVLKGYPDVIVTVLPELRALTQSGQWHASLRAVRFSPLDPVNRWAAFLQHCGTEEENSPALAETVLKSLKMSAKMTDGAVQLISWKDAALKPDTLQELLVRVGPDAAEKLIRLRAANRLSQGEREGTVHQDTQRLLEQLSSLLARNACFTLAQLAVNGRDMAAAGLKGPAIGQALNGLLLRVARGELPNEKEALLSAVRAGF